MRRALIIVLVLISVFSSMAHASEIPQISEELFLLSKQALADLASGSYEHIAKSLPFSEKAPTAADWQSFAEASFPSLIGAAVQTDYAVAYWNGLSWNLAIPVSEPNHDTLETLILTSADGNTFTSYGSSTWAEVKGEYLFASYVVWNKEYIESAPIIAID